MGANGPQGKFFRILVSKEPMCSENYGNEPRSGVLNCVFCGQHVNNDPSISYSFVVARNSSKKYVMLLVAVGPQSRARASHPPPHTHLHHALFNIPFRTLPPQHPRSSSKPSRLGCCCWRAHHAHMQVRQLACRRRRLSLSAVACAINWAVVLNISR